MTCLHDDGRGHGLPGVVCFPGCAALVLVTRLIAMLTVMALHMAMPELMAMPEVNHRDGTANACRGSRQMTTDNDADLNDADSNNDEEGILYERGRICARHIESRHIYTACMYSRWVVALPLLCASSHG